MQKTAYFYDNEQKALEFVNAYWSKVKDFGYKESLGGWYVTYLLSAESNQTLASKGKPSK